MARLVGVKLGQLNAGAPVLLAEKSRATIRVTVGSEYRENPRMPLLIEDFEPHPVLRGAHMMTVAPVFWPRTFSLPPPEDRLFQVDPESRLLAHCHWQPGQPSDAPVIVIVHGLEGSSNSDYSRGIAEGAFKRGYNAIRMNQRTCGGTELLTPTLYNSGMSSDYRAVCEELANNDGFKQIFFVGYSMGGNLVLKMAAEYGDSFPQALRGICAVCPAVDLAACADALERWDNQVYQHHFVASLMDRYRRKATSMPERYVQNKLPPVRTVRQFDDIITAPIFGYRDAHEYYEAASAKRILARLRVPTLLITAKDDPFVPYSSILAAGAEKNPAIQLVAPEHGGHCAFISNKTGQARFWAEQCVVDFCDNIRMN
ncbi:MAG TPA: alpha/beta fold hydrolase [Candidatus Acidoferrum sp.]|nr:alpha/beta fold hydrolase [Candidatus Acidoferrum sp.]